MYEQQRQHELNHKKTDRRRLKSKTEGLRFIKEDVATTMALKLRKEKIARKRKEDALFMKM
jgi:hypothetical protein